MDLGQVFTNRIVADYMVSLFSLDKSAKIIDPCFGNGSFLFALKKSGYYNIIGYEIDKSLFLFTKHTFKYNTLYNQDFLSLKNENFADGIIMNPPYIRQEKINELASLGITKKILRKDSLFAQLPTTANIYMYFIIKAISILKKTGELIVIFPSSWLNTKNGKQFEKIIYSQCILTEQIYLSGDVFEKNVFTDVIIFKLKKSKSLVVPKIKHILFSNKKFFEQNSHTSNILLDFSKSFDSYGIIKRGISTGFNSMYINPPFEKPESKKYLQKILSSPKKIKGYSTKNSCPDYIFIPNEKDSLNDEVKNYIYKYENKIKSQASPKTLYNKIQSDKNWFILHKVNSSGILFSYFVRKDMKFVYNDSDYLARDNFYIIRQKNNTDEFILFALLNNYYTFYQLEKSGKKYGAGLLKLQRYDLENLKFPDLSTFSNEDLEQLRFYASNLISTSDETAIYNITKIISQYSNVKYDILLKEYHSIKSLRLGNSYVS